MQCFIKKILFFLPLFFSSIHCYDYLLEDKELKDNDYEYYIISQNQYHKVAPNEVAISTQSKSLPYNVMRDTYEGSKVFLQSAGQGAMAQYDYAKNNPAKFLVGHAISNLAAYAAVYGMTACPYIAIAVSCVGGPVVILVGVAIAATALAIYNSPHLKTDNPHRFAAAIGEVFGQSAFHSAVGFGVMKSAGILSGALGHSKKFLRTSQRFDTSDGSSIHILNDIETGQRFTVYKARINDNAFLESVVSYDTKTNVRTLLKKPCV